MADAQLRAIITAEDRASKVIAGVGQSLEETKSKLSGALDFAKKLAPAFAVVGAASVAFATKGVLVAGQLESMRQGFVSLLGSAEAADKTMARIKQEAARTPFELAGLTSATQALALVTKDGDKAIDVLLNVGKALATAGKGQAELDRIIANLQQIALTGQITEMDIRQFGMSGVNILELLADHYGTTTEKASEMVKNSKDAFGDLSAAFAEAGAEGGRFADGFTNQAGTFNQLWSNLVDNFTIGLSEIVKATGIFDAVKEAMSRLSDAIPVIIDGIKSLVEWLKAMPAEWDEVNGRIQTFTDKILETQAAKVVIDLLKDSFAQVWAVVTETLIPALQELWGVFQDKLFPAVSELWFALQPLAPYFELMGRIIGGILVGALLVLIKAFTDVIVFAAGVLTGITRIVTYIAQAAAPVISDFASTVGGIARSFMSVVDAIQKAINKLDEFVSKAGGAKGIAGTIAKNLPIVGPLFGRAGGGAVSPNMPFMVGEHGPEMFYPQSYGQISNRAGGGITINISGNNFVGREGIAEQVGADIMRALRREALI